jgi:hypothetical protein
MDKKEVVDIAAKKLGCSSESCIIIHPVFKQFVVSNRILSKNDLDRELRVRFKPHGPRDSTALLNNNHIDETLYQWSIKFHFFYPCPFAMMDFAKTKEPLEVISMSDVYLGKEVFWMGGMMRRMIEPARCFGCVLNTDVSTGKGKHWVAIFVDMRMTNGMCTIEYFNSTGNPPPKPVITWMKKTKTDLTKIFDENKIMYFPVSDIEHQTSKTECGLYALFYIRNRLDGVSYKFFQENTIPDDAMTKFRKHIFRKS